MRGPASPSRGAEGGSHPADFVAVKARVENHSRTTGCAGGFTSGLAFSLLRFRRICPVKRSWPRHVINGMGPRKLVPLRAAAPIFMGSRREGGQKGSSPPSSPPPRPAGTRVPGIRRGFLRLSGPLPRIIERERGVCVFVCVREGEREICTPARRCTENCVYR